MLSTLDTIIAFAVIITVLSPLITMIVQMVSVAFSLRGKNLANALALAFQTIDSTIGEHAHSLAAQIYLVRRNSCRVLTCRRET